MTVHVTGRGVTIPETLRRRLEAKVGKVARLLPRATEARVVLAVERHRHLVSITLTGPRKGRSGALHAKATGADFQASVDAALEGLAEQARRRKERSQARPARRAARPAPGGPADPGPEDPSEPRFVVRRVGAKPMSVEEALDQMRLDAHQWLVFRNARSRVVNVLHRRADGVVELVEPGA